MKALFEFEIDAKHWLSMNGRYVHQGRARVTSVLREEACALGWALRRQAEAGRDVELTDIRTGEVTALVAEHDGRAPAWWSKKRPAMYIAEIGWPTSRRSDSDNAMPTVKALIDGLVDSGLVADDEDAVLHIRAFRRGEKARRGIHRVRIQFQDCRCAACIPEEGDDDASEA